jgi:histidine triad (HIT) family protein
MADFEKDCLFCKFAKHEIPCEIVFENDKVMALLDINPAGELNGHTLIIPKKHFKDLTDIEEPYLIEISKLAQKLTRAILKATNAEGLNLIQNNGKAAGQCIMHAHFHLIPRKHGDSIRIDEQRRKTKPLELIETAKAIKANL